MTREQARTLIFDALSDIAPEVNRDEVDDSLDLTEQLDLDSMDYLTWMIAISQAAALEIPQRDMSRFLTVDGAVTYLVEHATATSGQA
jgi:acyl carrier protein